MASSVRMHYCEEKGWICDVPQALTPMELQGVVNYTIKKQTDRIRGMGHGFVKERSQAALAQLIVGGWKIVSQVIVTDHKDQEKVLFTRRGK